MALALGSPAQAQDMLRSVPLHDWSAFEAPGDNWHLAGDVYADLDRPRHLRMETGTGVLVCIPTDDDRENLFTAWEHGDLTLELDFMMPASSNSGVYLQGRYEVQLFDSWGVRNPGFADVGGIYQRWNERREEDREGFDGVPPRINAGRAPGLWQHLEIDFRAPRFDERGRKTDNARMERVALNGYVIHENVELTGPTRAAAFDDEAPTGPLMIQGDHGPVALRAIRYKRYGHEAVRLHDVSYEIYDGEFDGMPSLERRAALRAGELDGFRFDVVGDLETFAAAFDGTLSVPTSGTYRFELDLGWVDDDPHFEGRPTGGANLRIDGASVVEHGGRTRVVSRVVDLESGAHGFELRYFKNRSGREPAVRLTVEGPDTRRRLLNADAAPPAPPVVGPIHVDPRLEPVLLRHMVDVDTTRHTHAVSVGAPSGVNYTVDLNRGALLRVWRGPFLDATPMWHGRGFHQLALPRASVVAVDEGVSVALLGGDAEPWPAEPVVHFDGFELDRDGLPTFHYEAGSARWSDRIEPDLDGRVLRRQIVGTAGLYHRVAFAELIERMPDGDFAVDGRRFLIRFDGGARPVLRSSHGEDELVVPLADDPVTYTIIW